MWAPPPGCNLAALETRRGFLVSFAVKANENESSLSLFSISDSALNQVTFIEDKDDSSPQTPRLRRFPTWALAHWCVTLFGVSFLILVLLPEGRLNDFEVPLGAETVRVARSLAARGAFADPFAVMPTGPTAHLAPVYPFLYSLVLRLFGTGYAALRIAWTLNVACFALQMSLLPVLSCRLRLGVFPGVLAAALGTCSLYAPIDSRWESFFAGTLLLLVYLTTEGALRDKRILTSVGAGASWGLVILTNPVTVLLLIAWPLFFLFSSDGSERRKSLQRVAVMISAALVIVSPWIVRNYARFGTFIFVRDNLGLELYTGNNDCAAPDLETNIRSGCHARTHPNPSVTVSAQLVAVGEVSFYRAKGREAIDWIATHRTAFLRLTLQRFRLFWFPGAERVWESVLVWAITLLSVPGLFLIAGKNRYVACVLATAWILFPVIYYVVPFEPRYRYPIYWTSLLPAGYALAAVSQRLPYFRRKFLRTSEST